MHTSLAPEAVRERASLNHNGLGPDRVAKALRPLRDRCHGRDRRPGDPVRHDGERVHIGVARSAAIYQTVLADGGFGVSMLSAHQENVARYFADHSRPRGIEEFAAVEWSPGPGTGAPILHGGLAWLDCSLVTSHEAGDHEIFIGSVQASGFGPADDALVFFCGGFHQPRLSKSRTIEGWGWK